MQTALNEKATPADITTAIGALDAKDIKSTLPTGTTYTYVTSSQKVSGQIGTLDIALKGVSERVSTNSSNISDLGIDVGNVKKATETAQTAADTAQTTIDNFIGREAGFATAAQGKKADSAVQDITSGNLYITKTIDSDINVNKPTLTLNVSTDLAGDKDLNLHTKVADAQAVKDYVDGLAGNYATAAQGTKADGAVQLGKENNSGENATSFVVDTVTDDGIIVKTKGGATISGIAKLSPRILQIGDGQASRVIPGAIVLSNKKDEDVYISSPSAGTINFLSNVTGNATTLTGIATPTADTDAANKKYVDSAVTSALTWEVI